MIHWNKWTNFVMAAKQLEIEMGKAKPGGQPNARIKRRNELCKDYEVDFKWFEKYKRQLKIALKNIESCIPAEILPDISLQIINQSASSHEQSSLLLTANSAVSVGSTKSLPDGWDFSHMKRQDIKALIEQVQSTRSGSTSSNISVDETSSEHDSAQRTVNSDRSNIAPVDSAEQTAIEPLPELLNAEETDNEVDLTQNVTPLLDHNVIVQNEGIIIVDGVLEKSYASFNDIFDPAVIKEQKEVRLQKIKTEGMKEKCLTANAAKELKVIEVEIEKIETNKLDQAIENHPEIFAIKLDLKKVEYQQKLAEKRKALENA